MTFKNKRFILWFKNIRIKDIPLVGGKNASLGEMYKTLVPKGINIPNGFALTAYAYFYFLKETGLDKELKEIFKQFKPNDIDSLQKVGKGARNAILRAELPKKLKKRIIKSYRKLSQFYEQKNLSVAVRSSATAEDLPSASFAGAQETYLNVSGEEELLKSVKRCIASLFTDRAISYREEKGFDHLKIALSVGIQKMVRSDIGSSGVMFSLDTETGFRDIVLINSIWGLGEMIVKGKITPDEFFVFKPTLKQGYESIIVKNLGRKTKKLVYAKRGGSKEVVVSKSQQLKFSLKDKDVLTLARWACVIEDHYSQLNGRWTPEDIEWAKDGKTGELFIVQSRPETIHRSEKKNVYREYNIKNKKEPILRGIAIGDKIGQGKARIISSIKQMNQFREGEILVTKMTDPDWVPLMKMASAIVTDEGSKTCFSGETPILTDKGILPIKEVVERVGRGEKLLALSLNKKSLSLEWKIIEEGMERKSQTIEVVCSQTGKAKNNKLRVTPDHKFITFSNRKIVSPEIQEIIKSKMGLLSVRNIPARKASSAPLSPKLGYLLGAISADGHVVYKKYGNKLSAQIFFIQRPSASKMPFIKRVKEYFEEVYQYSLHELRKPKSEGIIREKRVRGKGSVVLKCCKGEIVKNFLDNQKQLPNIVLGASPEFLLNFLAGVIDGDGSINKPTRKQRDKQRINIYCAKTTSLFRAIVIACLRLGVNYRVAPNRNIYNIQLVDGFDQILNYTARVKLGKGPMKIERGQYFLAKQLLEDIKEKINQGGKLLPYVQNNLLISSKTILNYVIPQIRGSMANHELTRISKSPLKMLRVSPASTNKKTEDVYNISVAQNHNYIVFTEQLTPLIVENCHAAIVSRELGVPCIVGTRRATKVLKAGQEITVDCTQGLRGKVFAGRVPYEIKEYNLKKVPKLKVKISVNIGAPEIAFKTSFLPVKGVGLAREEFIIAQKIKCHPLALYNFNKLKDRQLKNKIQRITVEHKNKREFFIKELAEGIGQIAAAFYPNEVIVRFSDFKTNEYAQLIGGESFEPKEENPMLGWRGASRYYDERFVPAFKMECQAIRRVRDVFGLKNVNLMIPFCRTPEEGQKVLNLMKKFGLKKGKDGLKVYVMCEIPSNVILIDEFLDIFDGMSIGSNDLTQLTMGMDRDNGEIAHIADERNKAVKESLKKVIRRCRERKKYVGICGDAPSTFSDFAEFLIKEKIDALSLSPDAVMKTIVKLGKK